FGSIAEGDTHVRNFLDGGDCRATIEVMRGLGVQIDVITSTELIVH
ncbi:MAG TPA: 3-phosphoshikimate 1-carboxyvinyltransferase, partial [Chloroflexi bacterium]|nr:3-phosphoshikimate 1-carboxyvinyltransferase [Chloroflexota bacterium]